MDPVEDLDLSEDFDEENDIYNPQTLFGYVARFGENDEHLTKYKSPQGNTIIKDHDNEAMRKEELAQ